LAEDNPVNQQVTAAMLKKRGHDVDIVDDGQAAVEAVQAKVYDVVVMDIQMPRMDGFEATEAIRERPEFGSLPVIAMTAHANREQCLARGMTDYLSKPFIPEDLFRAVERAAFPNDESSAYTPGAMTDPVDIEGFRASLREAGVEEVLGSLLQTFMGDAPGRMTDLEAAVAGDDGVAIDHAAHAYKSAAATIRAGQLAELLRQTEAAGERGGIEEARALAADVRAEHDRVMAFLQDHHGTESEGAEN
jgi:CheY-like chemotaxis protein/HPt (histidine-containing phosphotransfer) domain-containing protein